MKKSVTIKGFVAVLVIALLAFSIGEVAARGCSSKPPCSNGPSIQTTVTTQLVSSGRPPSRIPTTGFRPERLTSSQGPTRVSSRPEARISFVSRFQQSEYIRIQKAQQMAQMLSHLMQMIGQLHSGDR